jgi:probable selenium-dependent hydroxylase accessory protein YqeC
MFREHFAFEPHALVNFVGGGGKTALLHKMMSEYAVQGPVLCSTTTRIHPPDPKDGFTLISCDNPDLLGKMLESVARSCPENAIKLVATGSYMSPTLLHGVPADFCRFLDRGLFAVFMNEADGSASFSLKMPEDREPVLMESAEYLVPALGLDCVNHAIGPDVIFRWKNFLEYFPTHAHGNVTPQLAADVLMHPRGVCKGWKPRMKIIPFINKVDSTEQDAAARDLADRILHNNNFPVDRVLYGSVLHDRIQSISAA